MKATHTPVAAALCAFLTIASSFAQNVTETFEGFFGGRECKVTIIWAGASGTGGVEGRIVTDNGAILPLTGQSPRAGSLEIDVQGTRHTLAREQVGTKIAWVGRTLSFSREGGVAMPPAAAVPSVTSKEYLGFFRGNGCSVTLNWTGAAGAGEIEGKITMDSGAVMKINGAETRADFMEVSIENDPLNHKLQLLRGGGKTAWVGDYFSMTEKAATAPLPGAAPNGTAAPMPAGAPSGLPAGLPTTSVLNPSSVLSAGLPPLPSLPQLPPAGGATPSAPAMPAPGGLLPRVSAPTPGSGLTIMPPPTPGVPATGQPVQAEELTLNAMVWPVGKWPEGMAFDGEFLWVAESGQRNLAQINPSSGAVMGRVSSGRLPVGMVANQNTGEVWAEVATDQTLVKFNRAAKGGKFASIPDYPSGIAADGTAIWVLLWVDGSNAQGRVVRYDQRSAAMSKSELLGDAPSRIARAGQWLWVNQAKLDTTHLNLLDPASLTKKQTITLNGFCPEMAASENSVFLGGGRWDVDGLVVRVDPFTMQETARRQLPGEFTYRMTADNEFVVAAGMNGTLWVLAAADLTILRKIRLDYGNFQPSSLLIADGMLLVSTHNGAGENGAILVLKDWVPRLGHP